MIVDSLKIPFRAVAVVVVAAVGLILAVANPATGATRDAKVDLCHVAGKGNVIIIDVSPSAVAAHLAHGDFFPDRRGRCVAPPVIASFTAAPAVPINVGARATLRPTFAGGTGVILPGSLPAISGVPVRVAPTSTTEYTLVVTNLAGTSARATTTVTVAAASASVGTSGGTVTTPTGASVQIPFGALDGNRTITIAATTLPPPAGITPLSPVYQFGSEGTLFSRPVTVTLPLPAGVTSASVYWARLGGTGFDPIGGTVDLLRRTITCTTPHFSLAVIGPPVTTRTVTGVGQVTWISATTRQSVPIDFAGQDVEALVLDSSGAVVAIPGTSPAPGIITIPGVPVGEYMLHSGQQYLLTASNTPDLGSLRGGRPNRTFYTQPSTLNLSLSNLDPWQDGDQLEFYVSEEDDWDFGTERFTGLQPGDFSTTFAFDVSQCDAAVSGRCSPISADDHGVISQLSTRIAEPSGLPYAATVRLAQFPPFALPDGATLDVALTMSDVSTASTISIDFRGSQWTQALRDGNPGAVSHCTPELRGCLLAVLGQAGSAQDGFYTSNADLLLAPLYDVADINTGPMSYGSPSDATLAGNWGLLFDVRVGGGAFPTPLPGSIGLGANLRARGFFNGLEWTTSPDVGQAGPVVPPVSLPTSVTINGGSFFADTAGIGTTPTLSWAAPAIGANPFYTLAVFRLFIDANQRTVRTRTQVASVVTTATSLELPAGVLSPGQSYVFLLTSTVSTSAQAGNQLATAPFKTGLDVATATMSSGTFTP